VDDYFFRFPACVDIPGVESGVIALEAVLKLDVSDTEPGEDTSKLNLKREVREGVEGPVPAGVGGKNVALPKKLMFVHRHVEPYRMSRTVCFYIV